MLEINKIHQGDCLELMKQIPDGSIDCVISDVPYGIGIDTWDKPIGIPLFMDECKRLLKKEGFLCWFGQMPTMIDWINESQKRFKYVEHISWVKRFCAPTQRLSRGHESIFIYRIGSAKFYKLKGVYSDIKTGQLSNDIATIDAIDRTLKHYEARINNKGEENKVNGKIKSYQKDYNVFNRIKQLKTPHGQIMINFTNVWSFLPPTQKVRNGENIHPTQKPLELMERLVEMLSLENMTILDPFLGSGTTAVACKNLNRNFIGIELDSGYCEIANKRLENVMETII